MEERCYKAVNFDLSTHRLKEIYPGTDYRKAYDDLRKFFYYQNFSHRQGSGYLSNKKLTPPEIYDSMGILARQMPWIGACVNKMDVTNVGKQHDLTDVLKTTKMSANKEMTS